MSSYDFRYIGADSLPSRLSEFDLRQYFQLSRADILALTERFRIDRRAGAAILLLFLKVAGRPLDRFSVIPRSLLPLDGALAKNDIITKQIEGSINAASTAQVGRAKIRTILDSSTMQVLELK
jgi:hypothetical protein